jgi:hypothetical protein
MSIDPSYGLPASAFAFPNTASDELPPPIEETVEKPLKPGKWYGIISILCGLEPLLTAALIILIIVCIAFGMEAPPDSSLLTYTALVLFFASPLCVLAGLVFGILGCRTEGRYYANIGLVLSSLSALLVLGVVAMILHSILVPCC